MGNDDVCRVCGKPIPESRKRYRSFYCSHGCKLSVERNKYRKANPVSIVGRAQSGAVSELLVCADLLRRGFEVFRAVCPACSCDLAVLKDGILQRVEVKTGSRYIKVDGTVMHTYGKGHAGIRADILAVVDLDANHIIYTPPFPEQGTEDVAA